MCDKGIPSVGQRHTNSKKIAIAKCKPFDYVIAET